MSEAVARGGNLEGFEELEGMLLEAKAAKVKVIPTLPDLDDLLTESLALKAEAGAGKAYREKLKRGGLPSEEKLYIESKLREWEAGREWDTLSVCALFAQQTCACGHSHTTFKGFYYHQKHRTDKFAQRWVGVAEVGEHAKGLPQRTMLEPAVMALCTFCAAEHGFDILKGELAWTA